MSLGGGKGYKRLDCIISVAFIGKNHLAPQKKVQGYDFNAHGNEKFRRARRSPIGFPTMTLVRDQ